MKLVAPDYYEKFKCTADKCKHTCCKGWEIGIDRKTAEFYKSVGGKFGERLKSSVENDEYGDYRFILKSDERCPFLNQSGLCDIYSYLGENALCQVCFDHPRFRNFYEDRTEIGLGLSCEAVCKLVLESEEKAFLEVLEDDNTEEEISEETKEMYDFREKVFSVLQNRKKSIEKRIREIVSLVGEAYKLKSPKKQYEIYFSLEKLSDERDAYLNNLIFLDLKDTKAVLKEFETAFEQLLHYFVFRYLCDAVYDDKIKERLRFCADSTVFIAALAAGIKKQTGSVSLFDIEEAARVFSSEVEYSDENMAFFI